MTPAEDLARIDSVIDNTHCRAADSLTIGRRTVKALVADSRALRDLVEELPKCADPMCLRKATHAYGFMLGSGRGPSCDDDARDWQEQLPTAPVTRRLGL